MKLVRKNFKDIFGMEFLEGVEFDGKYDFPVVGNFDDLKGIDYLARYTDLKEYCKTKNTCLCFYEYDNKFDGQFGLFNSIIYKDKARLKKYKERFKNVKYIITTDNTLAGDFPYSEQLQSIFKSRVCFHWFKKYTNAQIIPNVRWCNVYSYDYAFAGIEIGSNIAIGFYGQIKQRDNRAMFINGFKKCVDIVKPKSIIVYGYVNKKNLNKYFGYALDKGIKIIVPHSRLDRVKKEGSLYGVISKIQ